MVYKEVGLEIRTIEKQALLDASKPYPPYTQIQEPHIVSKMRLSPGFEVVVLSLSVVTYSSPHPKSGDRSVFCRSEDANAPEGSQAAWSFEQFENLVVFGDSYSDENQFKYFASHNDSAPPVGTILPEVRERCRRCSG